MEIRRLLLVCLVCLWRTVHAAAEDELLVLSYHDVVAEVGDDAYATSRSRFVAQMDYLQTHGYQPVSLPFLDKVNQKQVTLPAKAVLLTFDDGLKSYAEFVVPLLEIYNYPSVLSVVTAWLDGKDLPSEYRGKLLGWNDLRELQKKPNVTIVSHTHDLHHGVQSNPQGNESAAGTTRIFSPALNKYESEQAFRQRITIDLQHTVNRFEAELKQKPTAITWPYGRYDGVLMDAANSLGMKYQLTLNDGPTTLSDLPVMSRTMVMNYGPATFEREITFQSLKQHKHQFVEIRLDQFAGQPAEKQEQILSSLLDNLKRLNVNTVLIHPFSRHNDKAYFYNQDMEVAADILNRVTHQISSRLGIRHIYLVLPSGNELRISPTLLKDLSRLSWFNGIVFNGQDSGKVDMIRNTVSYYHPRMKYGVLINASFIKNNEDHADLARYDFAVMSVTGGMDNAIARKTILQAKGLPVKVFMSVQVADNDKAGMAEVFTMMETLGIRHYGFAYHKAWYGLNDKLTITDELLAVFGG